VHRIDTFLELVVQQGGSDLHLISGQPPRIRLHGTLYEIKYRELTAEETYGLLLDIMPDHMRYEWESASCYSVDFAYEIPGMSRFRINVLRHLNGIGAVIRTIPSTLMSMEDLGLPSILRSLCREKKRLNPRHRTHWLG
jgi:twitching motility protein PilT